MAYIFTHDDRKERERLAAIEAMLDPFTTECLERIGVADGWNCLEIGAGGGSITEWLCRRVGADGGVVATDLQTKFLEAIDASNLEVCQHDLAIETLEPESFDLVTARKVLEHLHEPSAALRRMAGAVRRGGWLLVEDTDMATYRRFSCPEPERVERGYLSFVEAMSVSGFQPTFAKGLADELRGLGLEDIRFVCPIPVGFGFPDELQALGLEPSEQEHLPRRPEWNGADDSIGKVYRMTFERLRDHVTTSGLMTSKEVDQFLADIQSPDFCAATGFHCAAWGRKPA